MGNKMRGSKKCDFMININVAVTTVRRGPSRGDGDSDGGIGYDVKRLKITSMLLSLSVINGETFCRFLRATAEKAARYLDTSAVCTIGQQSRQCRESRCRKRRGRFTVTGTPIQDDIIRKQEGTNEAERFTCRQLESAKCIMVKIIVKKQKCSIVSCEINLINLIFISIKIS